MIRPAGWLYNGVSASSLRRPAPTGFAMNDDRAALAGFDGLARLFPLPSLVLFPHVVQDLHIFEPRYRQLMADVLLGDQLITMVLLKPDWEDEYDRRPAIEGVGCLGRVIWHEKLPDGRYYLRLRGLSRVRLGAEVPTGKLYRVARAELLADEAPADLGRLTALRRRLADVVLPRFAAGPPRDQLRDLFASDRPLGEVCDVLGYALPLPLPLKQSLLAEPRADRRAEAMARALDAPADDARRFPPEFSPN